MQPNLLLKTIAWNTAIAFTWTQLVWAAPASNFFSRKRPDHQADTQRQLELLDGRRQLQAQQLAEKASEHAGAAREAFQLEGLADLTDLYLPQEYGRITEVYDPPGIAPEERRLVIHIQDLHTQPEAQRSLIHILQHLRQHHDLEVVCSEGAAGRLQTEVLARFPSAEVRARVAGAFLEAGELTGEEYLAITTDPTLPIEGIEDAATYFPNLVTFHDVMADQSGSQLLMDQLTAALEALKPILWHRELLELDAQQAVYDAGTLAPSEYLESVQATADRVGLDVATRYPQVAHFAQLLQLEVRLDESRTQEETSRLLSNLSTAALADADLQVQLEPLFVASVAMEQHRIGPKTFYAQLAVSADPIQPDWRQVYPSVAAFHDYLEAATALDGTALYRQLRELYAEVQQRLAKTDQARALADQLHRVAFLNGFMNLRVSNEELDTYLADRDSYALDRFRAFLEPQLTRQGLTEVYVDYNPAALDDRLPLLERFYELVKQRDVSMVRNTLRVMDEHRARRSVLIAGGFHTRGITQLLREAGVSYVVVSPTTDVELDYDRYHDLLAGVGTPLPQLVTPLLATGGLRTMLPLDLVLEDESHAVVPSLVGTPHARATTEDHVAWAGVVRTGLVLAMVLVTAALVGPTEALEAAQHVPADFVGFATALTEDGHVVARAGEEVAYLFDGEAIVDVGVERTAPAVDVHTLQLSEPLDGLAVPEVVTSGSVSTSDAVTSVEMGDLTWDGVFTDVGVEVPTTLAVVTGIGGQNEPDKSATPVHRRIADQISAIEQALDQLGENAIESRIKQVEQGIFAGRIKLKGEEADILDSVGDASQVIGQIDRKLAKYLGYVYQTANAFVTPPGRATLVLTRRAHNQTYGRSLTIYGGRLAVGQTHQEGVVKELIEETELGGLDNTPVLVAFDAYDEPGDSNRERRSVFAYELSPQEDAKLLGKDGHKERMERLKASMAPEAYKTYLESEQKKGQGGGEVWAIYEVSLHQILTAPTAWYDESPYENKVTRYLELTDVFSDGAGGTVEHTTRAFFTPDLLNRFASNTALMERIGSMISQPGLGQGTNVTSTPQTVADVQTIVKSHAFFRDPAGANEQEYGDRVRAVAGRLNRLSKDEGLVAARQLITDMGISENRAAMLDWFSKGVERKTQNQPAYRNLLRWLLAVAPVATGSSSQQLRLLRSYLWNPEKRQAAGRRLLNLLNKPERDAVAYSANISSRFEALMLKAADSELTDDERLEFALLDAEETARESTGTATMHKLARQQVASLLAQVEVPTSQALRRLEQDRGSVVKAPMDVQAFKRMVFAYDERAFELFEDPADTTRRHLMWVPGDAGSVQTLSFVNYSLVSGHSHTRYWVPDASDADEHYDERHRAIPRVIVVMDTANTLLVNVKWPDSASYILYEGDAAIHVLVKLHILRLPAHRPLVDIHQALLLVGLLTPLLFAVLTNIDLGEVSSSEIAGLTTGVPDIPTADTVLSDVEGLASHKLLSDSPAVAEFVPSPGVGDPGGEVVSTVVAASAAGAETAISYADTLPQEFGSIEVSAEITQVDTLAWDGHAFTDVGLEVPTVMAMTGVVPIKNLPGMPKVAELLEVIRRAGYAVAFNPPVGSPLADIASEHNNGIELLVGQLHARDWITLSDTDVRIAAQYRRQEAQTVGERDSSFFAGEVRDIETYVKLIQEFNATSDRPAQLADRHIATGLRQLLGLSTHERGVVVLFTNHTEPDADLINYFMLYEEATHLILGNEGATSRVPGEPAADEMVSDVFQMLSIADQYVAWRADLGGRQNGYTQMSPSDWRALRTRYRQTFKFSPNTQWLKIAAQLQQDLRADVSLEGDEQDRSIFRVIYEGSALERTVNSTLELAKWFGKPPPDDSLHEAAQAKQLLIDRLEKFNHRPRLREARPIFNTQRFAGESSGSTALSLVGAAVGGLAASAAKAEVAFEASAVAEAGLGGGLSNVMEQVHAALGTERILDTLAHSGGMELAELGVPVVILVSALVAMELRSNFAATRKALEATTGRTFYVVLTDQERELATTLGIDPAQLLDQEGLHALTHQRFSIVIGQQQAVDALGLPAQTYAPMTLPEVMPMDALANWALATELLARLRDELRANFHRLHYRTLPLIQAYVRDFVERLTFPLTPITSQLGQHLRVLGEQV